MNIKPTGHHVLIKLHELKDKFEGSPLYKPDTVKKKDQLGGQFAEILAVGPTAWDEYANPWAKVGDIVLCVRYAGAQWDYDGDDKLCRIINDDEIIAVEKPWAGEKTKKNTMKTKGD